MSAPDSSAINVFIAMANPNESSALRRWLEQEASGVIQVIGVYDTGSECHVNAFNEPHPDVILAEDNLPSMNGLELAQRLRTELPWVSVVVLSSATAVSGPNGAASALEGETTSAMIAGAAGYVAKPSHPQDYDKLRGLIVSVGRAARSRRVIWEDPTKRAIGRGGAHVIAVYGPKGGVGRTVIAAKLAYLLANPAANGTAPRVALCELGVAMSDLQPLLEAKPSKTVTNLVRLQDDISREHVLNVMQSYPGRDNLRVLFAPRLEAREPLTGNRVTSIVFGLRPHFDYVVIDTGAGFGAVTQQVLRNATQHVLVTTPDLLGFENTRLVYQAAKTLNKPTEFVINRFHKSSGYKPEAVVSYIGAPDSTKPITIEDEPHGMRYALDTGELLQAPNDRRALNFTQQVYTLAERIQKQLSITPSASRIGASH